MVLFCVDELLEQLASKGDIGGSQLVRELFLIGFLKENRTPEADISFLPILFMPTEAHRSLAALTVLVVLLIWETALPFFPFPKGRARMRHGTRNMVVGVGNGLLTAFVFASCWWWAAHVSETRGIGVLHWFSWPPVVEGLTAVLLLDLWTYAWHRLNHRVPFFWRFHRVHHSDLHMDVTTANRFHIGEIALSSVLRIPLVLLLGIRLEHLVIYEVLMFAVVQFHHANITLGTRWDRWLSWIIVTPFMHKIHHSRWQPETDSNYASLLSVWDRVFGSFRTNAAPSKLRLGLTEFSDSKSQTFTGMLFTPLATPRAPRSESKVGTSHET